MNRLLTFAILLSSSISGYGQRPLEAQQATFNVAIQFTPMMGATVCDTRGPAQGPVRVARVTCISEELPTFSLDGQTWPVSADVFAAPTGQSIWFGETLVAKPGLDGAPDIRLLPTTPLAPYHFQVKF